MNIEEMREKRFQVIESSINGSRFLEVWDSEESGYPSAPILFASDSQDAAQTYADTGIKVNITDGKQFPCLPSYDGEDIVWFNPETECYHLSNMPEKLGIRLVGVAPYGSHVSGIFNTLLDHGIRPDKALEKEILQLFK